MQFDNRPRSLWVTWLTVASVGVIVFGLFLVIAPAATRQFFSLLVYSDAAQLETYGSAALAYISLVHAVLGGVMIGWGVALLWIVRRIFATGNRDGWFMITISLLAWFVPDTAYSILSGFWQNAVLNVGFLVLFAVPLAATCSQFRKRSF